MFICFLLFFGLSCSHSFIVWACWQNTVIFELKMRVDELKMENAYQLRLRDVSYNEKIKELTEKFVHDMEQLKTNIAVRWCSTGLNLTFITRDVKSSRPKWPRGQNFGLGLGLGLKHLASAWPRSAAEEPAAKKKSTECDGPICLHFYFADYRTSHYDRRYCARLRERMRNRVSFWS